MKKLTDVLKYNKEIQKKNQGAVINQNNPVKPKQTINVFPSVNDPAPSPIEQIRTSAPKTTTPFAPVRTNVSDIREEVNPVNRFNTFMQTPKGQELSANARQKYSYFSDVDDYIGKSAYMRQYLPESIKFFHSQAAKQQDMVIEYTQGREIREDDYSAVKEYNGIKSNRDRYMQEERNKRNELESIYADIANHLSDTYSPEQIADYYSYYSRIKPEDSKTLEAIKKAEQLYYSKSEQREYNKVIEEALSGSEESEKWKKQADEKIEYQYATANKALNEKKLISKYPELSEFEKYVYGKYDAKTANEMYYKYYNDIINKDLIDRSEENWFAKNIEGPVANVAFGLASPIYGAEMLVQNTKNMYSGKNEPVSMYSPGNAVMAAKDASAEAFTVGDSEGTAFLKNVLLSVGGNAANVALFGAATPYMMALQSGSSTAYETMKKGGTTQQAVLNGVIGGTIEYFTEKLPFEKLTETFTGAKGLKNMSKADVTKFIASRIGLQAVAEYGEETVNSYASTIADMIVMGEKSDYMQYVNELVKDGQSTEKAYEMANKKFFLTDPQMAGLSGLISGGLMSTGAVTLGTMKAASEGKGQVVTYTASDKLDKDALETLNNIAKASGVNITVEDLAPVEVTDENGNKKYMINKGETDANGTIRINSSEMGSVEDALVAYHEVTHTLENTEAYDAYRDIALNIMYGGRGTEAYNQAMSAKSSQYGDKAQGTDLLEKELVAEFTRIQLSNEGVVERIVKENRNVATRIYNALKKAYTNIKNKLQGKETNLTDMEKAINLFEKALAENRKISFTEAVVRGNTDTRPYIDDEGMVQFDEGEQGEKRYAIETLPDGKKYVQADRQVMFSSNPDSWGEDLEKYVNDEIRKGKDVKVTSEDGNVLTITAKTAWKLGDRNEVTMPDGNKRLMTDDEYATKLTAGSHIDEIAQLLKGNDKYVPDTKDHDFAKDGFTYKNAFFRDFDGTYYRLGVSIGKSGEIKSIYNIGILDKRSFPSTGSSSPKGGAQNVGKASKNNIPHQKAIVNNNDMQKSQNNAQGSNGKQHLLGGEATVVANNKTLAEARRMILKGEPQSEIFRETGWYKGIDNKWRYEIPDDNARFERKGDLVFKKDHPDYARYRELLDIQDRYLLEMEGGRELTETEKKEYEKLKNIWSNTFTQNGKVTPDAGTQDRLEAYFDHPELYEAYPQLKDLKIVFNKDYDGYGEYRPDIKTIVVRERLDNEFAEKVLLHEVQHAIQDIEGFEIGSNREEALENVRAEAATELINIKDKEFAQAKTVQEVNSVIDRNLIKWYNSIYGNVKTIEDVAYRAYLDYYGEREAREVVERAKMSSEERKRTFPEREYLIKPFTKGNYNENSRQNQTLYSSQNSNVSNKTQKEKSIEIHGTQKQHLLGAEVTEETKIEAPEYNSTAKSRERLTRCENGAVKRIADAMSVRLGTAREFLKPIIQEMSNEYMKTGKLSQDTIDRLFEEAYKNGRKVNDEAYKEYADLRNYLRNTKIYFDSESAADIPDFFKDIRRYMGRLSVSSTNGTSVDSIYQELNEMHPSLFPEDILSSSDRMLRIMEVSDSLRKEEVTLDAYYNTEEAKGDLKHEFEKAVYAFKDNLYEVKHFNDSLESDVVEKTTKKPLKEGEIAAPESLEELCGKGLVKVVNISKPEDMRTYRQRRIDIRKNAEKAEIFSKPYENRDTGMKIFIVPNSYTHTFSNKGEENIRVAEHLPELIENAVLTHKENTKGADKFSYTYTFFAAVDDDGVKAVKLKVKEYNERHTETAPQNVKDYFEGQVKPYSKLYDAKVLTIEEIEIIKEPDASGKVPYNNGKVTQSTSSSNISVSQLMKLVKGDAEKYIPKSGVQEAYSKLSIYQKEADKVMNNLLLTKDENAILDDMLKGNRKALREDIPDRMNKDNILKAYEVKAPVKAMQNIIENHKKSVRKNKNDTAMKMIELSDFWKDKKNGLMYMINSQERNVEDIVKNDKQADKIIETYFKPVHDHEGDRKKFKHEYFKRVREMEIDLRVRSGNKNTESEAIQFIGEVEGDIADLETKAKNRKLTDDENDKLINLKGSLVEFKENNPNLDYNKINSCIKEFHKIYDELFEEMNIVRVRNGYAPVEYRKNYFPHFMETGTDEITGKIAKALGINVDVTELPTDLAGRTENFKPGIAWVQHVKRRNTNVTKYDAVEGFQKYIEGVSDVIFHTDDIQNLRALERALRYKYSEKGVKDEIDALRDRTDVTDDERETLLEEAGKRKITHLGHYVNNLTEYTNLLANKKHSWDRPFENALGRGIYNVLNWGNSRVASNLIVGNLSTPLTNLIPLVQATPLVGEINMMVGFNQTVKNFLYDDGMTERSAFLTNRFGQEKLISKSKVADKLVWLMETVDELSSGTVWRARYHQNIKKGMSDADAIKDADKYAANLIADRSKGSLPTLFGVKNPIVKAFTAFQVETNNQLHHLFKDIPKEAGEKLALVLFKYFLGAYLFNDVYEKVVGRRPALDPLSWTNEFVGDLTGYQMPNSIDIIASLVKREKVDFSTTKFKNSQAIANLGKNIAEDIPFIGGMLGGGRIPISSALPDVGELNKLNDDISNKKKAEIIHKNTISGGLINILMPYAGSQLTKTMKGIKAFAEGGSYSLNNDGEEQLQYPMERDLLTGAQSAIFGKNATKGARNWVEEGFGSLTAEQTDLYQRIIEDKKTSRTDVYNAISNARKAESVKDGDKSRTETQVRHEIVSKAKGLSWKQKYMIEYSFMSDENKEKIKAMTNNGVSQDTAYRVLYEYADSREVSKEAKYKKYYEMSDGGTSVVAEKWGYEPELSVIKREALAHDSKLTAEEKQTINTALFGESETEYDFSNVDNYYYSTLSKNQKKGYDQYIKLYGKNSMNARTFYYAIKVMNSTKDGNGSKKVAKVTRLRKAGFTLAQANRIYNILN